MPESDTFCRPPVMVSGGGAASVRLHPLRGCGTGGALFITGIKLPVWKGAADSAIPGLQRRQADDIMGKGGGHCFVRGNCIPE